ncbi:MAG: hypothetical protein JW963_16245, partial [Anaerolineales bacterium]|nr:hypothetical protein [Anaerolineales bacterium]
MKKFERVNGSRTPRVLSAGYRRLAGRGLAPETDKTQSHEKTNLAVRIHPSGAPKKMGAIIFYERNRLSTKSILVIG